MVTVTQNVNVALQVERKLTIQHRVLQSILADLAEELEWSLPTDVNDREAAEAELVMLQDLETRMKARLEMAQSLTGNAIDRL